MSWTWGSPVPTGPAYLGSAGDQWNQFVNPNGLDAYLTNTAGQLTSAQLAWMGTGTVASAATNNTFYPLLMNYYLFNNVGGSITVGITGLVPDSSYNLALYSASWDASGDIRSENFTVVGSAVNSYYATGNPVASFDPTSTPLNNFNYLTVTSSALGTLTITETDGYDNQNGEVDLNGFQLQGQFNAIPEPTPMAVLGLGALGLLVRRKRR